MTRDPSDVDLPAQLSALRVLVVDDDEDLREALVDTLAALGHLVATAKDGLDALEQVARWHPDVILFDLEMPLCDGEELRRRLQGLTAARLVLMSGVSDVAQRASRLGVEHLKKPFDLRELAHWLAA